VISFHKPAFYAWRGFILIKRTSRCREVFYDIYFFRKFYRAGVLLDHAVKGAIHPAEITDLPNNCSN
jgi:hypothetical protein